MLFIQIHAFHFNFFLTLSISLDIDFFSSRGSSSTHFTLACEVRCMLSGGSIQAFLNCCLDVCICLVSYVNCLLLCCCYIFRLYVAQCTLDLLLQFWHTFNYFALHCSYYSISVWHYIFLLLFVISCAIFNKMFCVKLCSNLTCIG